GREGWVVVGRLARQRGRHDRLQPLRLLALPALVALHELRQHLGAEELEALHDVFVAVLPRLAAEDHLVDAALLVPTQVVTDLVGSADGAPQPEEAALLHDLRAEAIAVARRGLDCFRRVAPLTTSRAVLRPDVGAPGPVTTEDVVV